MLIKIGGQRLYAAEGTGGASGEVSGVQPTAEEVKDTGGSTEDAGNTEEIESRIKSVKTIIDGAVKAERDKSRENS